ncbi:atp-dependent rna helicase dbp3 [Diplodia corticola]|uniref:RNA helicase n=1 Tax=Diplodia corticola TaxID=236234 RepID=A0A1J9QQ11_9PEZI|nr:atp-dependent rna helicase dbp3 [Diplodia corticola]OJD30552.1 atp-dependent rna helicase dbp3 [Diplodia corticola]
MGKRTASQAGIVKAEKNTVAASPKKLKTDDTTDSQPETADSAALAKKAEKARRKEEKAKAKEEKKQKKREAKQAAEANGVASEDVDMVDAPTTSEDVTEQESSKEKKKEKREKKDKKDKKEKKDKSEKKEKKAKKATNGVEDSGAVPAINGTAAAAADAAPSGYVEDPALSALPQSEIDAFMSKHFIAVTDPLSTATKLRPIITFNNLPVTDESLRAPFKGFTAPTPIQAAAWPSLLAGRDVIGVAETGSGKTLGFGVPCVRHIMRLPKGKGVKAVIVSPTRELASQIHEQLVKIAEPAGLKSVCIYGGVPKDEQKIGLKKASIVVATPGRLNDLIDEGAADISKADYVVLDEADRMLDKGFEDAIRKIISSTRPLNERQTLMFTATWPKSVQELASTFMKSPVKITIGDNPTGELRANTRISQTVEVVEPRDKDFRLSQLLKEHTAGSKKNDRILIFCLYKKEATRVEETLRRKGFRVGGIHGDLSQAQRTASLEKFKKGEIPLLVATDVAARGLDIPAVKVVINVTFPLTAEDYVHRIGRTGRAGQDGKAITLFTEHDKPLAGALVNVLKGANQPVPEELMKFGTTVKKKGHEAYGAFFKDTTDMKQATKITFDD